MTNLTHPRRPSLTFSDFGSDDEQHVDTNDGDYSARMGELFDDDQETTPNSASHFRLDHDGRDDEEAFIYDGVDAHLSRATYREQLRDVLDDDDGDDDDQNDDEAEEREVEHSLVHDDFDHPPIAIGDEALVSQFPPFLLSFNPRSFRVATRPRHANPDTLPTHLHLHLRISPLLLTCHVFVSPERRVHHHYHIYPPWPLPALSPPDHLTPPLLHAPGFFSWLLRYERTLYCLSWRLARRV
jgi:hypothetical protein